MPAPKGNKNAVGNEGGRPPLFNTPLELQKKIDEYFSEEGKKSICGLAYFLGFESRQSFYDYEKRVEFTYNIRRARLKIEQLYEENLQGNNATGSIFALKNMDWQDRSATEHIGEITIKVKYEDR